MSFGGASFAAPAERLAAFFKDSQPRISYEDSEIDEITALLEQCGHIAQKCPRTYILLRTIGHLELLDRMVNEGFGDQWFPVEHRSLPNFLDPSIKTAIVQRQRIILTKSIDLEKGRHRHFAPEETLPFDILGRLGTGGYGQVDKILSKISFRHYALKRVRRRAAFGNNSREGMKTFINELRIVSSLKHKHFVEYIGSYTDKSYLGLVISPVADSDLALYMQHMCDRADNAFKRYGQMTAGEMCVNLKTYFGCLAAALTYLHNQSIRHKDIKPQNILVAKGNVLFSDFGLSRDFADDVGSTTSGLTPASPRYCAPEVAIYEARNTSSDIWSLGCVFLEMTAALHGLDVNWIKIYFTTHGSQAPHFHSNPDATQRLLSTWETSWNRDDTQPLAWIKQMVLMDRQKRPTAARVLELITTSDLEESICTTYCGICCIPDHDTDSCDSLADDLDDLTVIPYPKPAILTTSVLSLPSAPVKKESTSTADIAARPVSMGNLTKDFDFGSQTPRPLSARIAGSNTPLYQTTLSPANADVQGAGRHIPEVELMAGIQSPSVAHSQTIPLKQSGAPSPRVESGLPSAHTAIQSAAEAWAQDVKGSRSSPKEDDQQGRKKEPTRETVPVWTWNIADKTPTPVTKVHGAVQASKGSHSRSEEERRLVDEKELTREASRERTLKSPDKAPTTATTPATPSAFEKQHNSSSPSEQHSTHVHHPTNGPQAEPSWKTQTIGNTHSKDPTSFSGLKPSGQTPRQRSPSPFWKPTTRYRSSTPASKEEQFGHSGVRENANIQSVGSKVGPPPDRQVQKQISLSPRENGSTTPQALKVGPSVMDMMRAPGVFAPAVFGIPLSMSIGYAGIFLINYKTTAGTYLKGRIPVVVAKCGDFLKSSTNGLGTVDEDRLVDCLVQIFQGTPVFDTAKGKTQLRDDQAIFDAYPFYGKNHAWEKNDGFRAGATLFHFLESLPEPLIPNDAHRKILQTWLDEFTRSRTTSDRSGSVKAIRSVLRQIPLLNLKVVLYMLDLFAVCTSNALGRPQRITSLAMKYHRCFFKLEVSDFSPLHEKAGHELAILQFLISHAKQFLEEDQQTAESGSELGMTELGYNHEMAESGSNLATAESGSEPGSPAEDPQMEDEERSVIFSVDPSGHPFIEQLLAMGITKDQIEENIDSVKLYIDQKSPSSKVRNREIFGVPLWISYQYAQALRSLGEDFKVSALLTAQVKVPIIIAECCIFLTKKSYTHDGFHVSSEQDQEQVGTLVSTFDSFPSFGRDIDWTGYNARHAGTTLQLYLSSLPEPIIPSHMADRLIESVFDALPRLDELKRTREELKACIILVSQLPRPNHDLLLYLLGFFKHFEQNFPREPSFDKLGNTFRSVFFRTDTVEHTARATLALRIVMSNAYDIIEAAMAKRHGYGKASPEYVKALYDFESDTAGDLSFKTDDQIRVLKKTESTDDWWTGELRGVEGIFPANYCKPVR